MLKINILTTFTQFFESPLKYSLIAKALAKSPRPFEVNLVDIRDFSTDKHRTTDDRPYAGGPGMLMKVEPIFKALTHVYDCSSETEYLSREKTKTLLLSASGDLFNQQTALEYSQLSELTIICGHYEGVDQRVADHLVNQSMRVGNYVTIGGEPASLVILEAIVRLLPGVIANPSSLADESHLTPGYLEYPQYTRPESFRGWGVPQILLSGNHQQIKAWQELNHKREK